VEEVSENMRAPRLPSSSSGSHGRGPRQRISPNLTRL
jgi:hypothetical protein